MKIQAATLRRRRLSLTSLIDVIFLLLLFFMLSSTFTKFTEIEFSNVGSEASHKQSTDRPIFITLKPDALLMNGAMTTLADLKSNIATLTQNPNPTILISITADVTSQRLVNVLNDLNRNKMNVQILTPAPVS